MSDREGFRSGLVALLGRPNVGKSSLVNALVGRKAAIVSPKPQTTRRRIQAVLNVRGAQAVFLDTPGVQRARDLLGSALVRAATQAVDGVDLVLLVADAARARGAEDRAVMDVARGTGAPCLLVVNKIDLTGGAGGGLPARVAREMGHEGHVLATSAVTGYGIAHLRERVLASLPPGPMYFPDGLGTDQPEEMLLAELVREQVLLQTGDEVPHETAVLLEEMTRRPSGLLYLRAVIVVERPGQKAIVIGEGGRMLREIGRAARAAMEEMFGVPVYLDLWVKVEKGWRDSAARLREFGYESD